MCPAGYPEKHTPRLYPRHKQDQPAPLLSRVPRSPSKLGLLAPVLEARPQYGAKTSTYPRLQSVDVGGTRVSSGRTTGSSAGRGRAWARRRSPDHGHVTVRDKRGKDKGQHEKARGSDRLRPVGRARPPSPIARPGVGPERLAVVTANTEPTTETRLHARILKHVKTTAPARLRLNH
jgi:hypothetical protein